MLQANARTIFPKAIRSSCYKVKEGDNKQCKEANTKCTGISEMGKYIGIKSIAYENIPENERLLVWNCADLDHMSEHQIFHNNLVSIYI